MHSKFALRPHHVWKYGRHPMSDLWRLGKEIRKEERKKKPQDENIYIRIVLCRAAINNEHVA